MKKIVERVEHKLPSSDGVPSSAFHCMHKARRKTKEASRFQNPGVDLEATIWSRVFSACFLPLSLIDFCTILLRNPMALASFTSRTTIVTWGGKRQGSVRKGHRVMVPFVLADSFGRYWGGWLAASRIILASRDVGLLPRLPIRQAAIQRERPHPGCVRFCVRDTLRHATLRM